MLGPLLFIIYVNDITTTTSLFKIVLFADDTTLYSHPEIVSKIKQEIMLGMPHITNMYIDVNLKSYNAANENISEILKYINENSTKQTKQKMLYIRWCIFRNS